MSEKKIGAAYVEILTKGITQVQADLDRIKNKLTATAGGATAVSKETGKMTEAAKQGVPVFEKLQATLQNASKIAAAGFLAGTAAITGFISAADPAGFTRFQGTLAALTVQIGSIFLPLLDKVQAVLDRVLNYFRSLSAEQKQNILRWVEIAGAIAIGVVVFGKIVAAINMASAAMAAFGVETGIASGGITTVLGVIATLLTAMGVFALTTDTGSDALKEFRDALKPIADALKEVADIVLGVLTDAFEQIKPLLLTLVKDWADNFKQLVEQFKPLLQTWAGNFATAVQLVIDIFQAVLPMIQAGMKMWAAVAGVVMPVLNAYMTVYGEILKALAPVILMAVKAVSGFYTILYALVTKVLSAYKPVIEGIMAVVGEFAKLWQEVVNTVMPLFEALQDVLMEVAQAFMEAFGDVVVGVVKGMLEVVKWVVNGVKELLQQLREMIELARRGMEMLGLPVRRRREPQAPQAKEVERHEGQAVRKVEMTGFTELWKKAMQSTLETPEQKKLAEIGRNQEKAQQEREKQTRVLQDLRDGKQGGVPQQAGGMGF